MKNNEHIAYLSLGSNIDPEVNIPAAVDCLKDNLEVIKISSCWESIAVGSSGPRYLNAAIAVKTHLTQDGLKQELIAYIEDQMGRERTRDKYADRTIDIDVLVYDDQIIDPDIWDYAHVALPLSELYPNLRSHDGAVLKKIVQSCLANTDIKKRPDIVLK